MGCYIWYSKQGPGRAAAAPTPSPLLAVPYVTAHQSTASVPITVLLYDGPLLCGFNVAIKDLMVIVLVALVPEAPTNLQVSAESTTSIRVTWDSPLETNGPIVTYKVCLLLHYYLTLATGIVFGCLCLF